MNGTIKEITMQTNYSSKEKALIKAMDMEDMAESRSADIII